MVDIQLTETETRVLKRILIGYLSDLRMEIADTDSMDFRVKLKEQEAFLKELIRRLSPIDEPLVFSEPEF